LAGALAVEEQRGEPHVSVLALAHVVKRAQDEGAGVPRLVVVAEVEQGGQEAGGALGRVVGVEEGEEEGVFLFFAFL
jgi:hypothetical protein